MNGTEPELKLRCVGINHRTAPLPVRESMWFSGGELLPALRNIRESYASECFLISTCNRTELYYVPAQSEPDTPVHHFLAGLKGHTAPPDESHFYTYSGLQPVKHLFKVVSGLDSMVLGDVQITAQVKEAFMTAVDAAAAGTLINKLFTSAMHTGKRVRTETQIGEGAISVSYLAAELATKIFADLSRRTALLIGIGETGKLTAKHLASRALGNLLIANRTISVAERIAPAFDARVVPLENIEAELPGVDIIITAVQTSRPILTREQVAGAMKSRDNRPLIVVDLGVPRNVDPEVHAIDSVFLHDVDALNRIIDQNIAHRLAEVPKAQKILLHELTEFQNWTRSVQLGPTIHDLRERFETIREQEVSRVRHRFDPGEQEQLDILTRRIVNKLLHVPMTNLRNGHGASDSEENSRRISIVRHLFGLDKHS